MNDAYQKVTYGVAKKVERSISYPSGSYLTNKTTYSQAPEVSATKYRTGYSTPNWKVLKRKGTLPMTKFDWSQYTYRYPKGWVTQKSVSYYAGKLSTISVTEQTEMIPTSQLITFLSPTAAEISTAYRVAVTKSLLKLKDQKVNLAQFWGERKQTVALIADTAMKIAGAFRSLKHGDIISAGKALGSRPSRRIRRNFRELHAQKPQDAAADAWLAMQYGWIPLLSEVKGAAEALAERDSDIQRFNVTSSHAVTGKDIQTWPFGPGVGIPGGLVRTWKVTYKFTYTFSMTQSTGGLANAHTLSALGLTNPLALGWELLPYSFVVDWFLPIGDYLSSLDAQMGLSFSTGCSVKVVQEDLKGGWSKPEKSWGSTGGNDVFGDVTVTGQRKSIERRVLTAFPLPQLPAVKNPVSVTHAANAIALLSSVFRKKA